MDELHASFPQFELVDVDENWNPTLDALARSAESMKKMLQQQMNGNTPDVTPESTTEAYSASS